MAPGHPVPAEAADESAASFGALLRTHRDTARLTQSELAARAEAVQAQLAAAGDPEA